MTRSNTLLVLLLVVTSSVVGAIVARSIASSVFPELQFGHAAIIVEAGELPAEQTLVAVTRPLEEAAYGVTGVRWVRSTTTRGAADIDVTFNEGVDPIATFQLLSSALSGVQGGLPADAKLDSRLMTSDSFEILDISMSSTDRSLAGLTDIAQYDLVPSLHRIDGTYLVEVVGGKYREYVLDLDPRRMLQHGLTASDITAALAKANVIESAGRIIDAHRMLSTVVSADLHDADQLAATPVATVNGQPVYVRDIGHVELAIREDYIRTYSENGPAVLIGVARQPHGNTDAISTQAHQVVDQFRARYPDVRFSFSYDQATLVSDSFNSVRDAIVLGLSLGVGVVFLFTWSVISALVAAIVVPCTIMISFLVMKGAGVTFNMMSLGGFAAGIGLFIDDAIVMIEAIHRAHARGELGESGVAAATAILTRPLIAATATVIVAFAPLAFVSGVTGVFFRTLSLTLGGGLFVSLLLALFFTPALERIFERFRRAAREPGRVLTFLQDSALFLLRPFVRFPILAPLVAVASLGAAVLFYYSVGTDYLPALDEGAFVLDYILPPQTTMHDGQVLLGKIRDVLKTTPEVAAFSQRTGQQLGFFLTESNVGDFSIRLKEDRSRSIDALTSDVRKRVESALPNVQIEFSQVLQDLIGDLSGAPEPIQLKIFGADQAQIEKTAAQIAPRLSAIPNIVDVKSGLIPSNPEEEVIVDQTAAARYGLNPSDILATLQTTVAGTVATQLRVGDRLYGVRVRYPDEYHNNLSLLPSVLMHTPAGGLVPMSSLTRLEWRGTRLELDRERLVPVVYVTARVENTDLGTAIARLKDNLAHFTLPAGVTIEYGGLYADQQKAFSQLALVMVAAMIAMFLVLLWEFGRLTPAIAILLSSLACLAGSFAALDLVGLTLNISSFMGIVMVAGITAKNGILLLDQAERERAGGLSPRESLRDAAGTRLRPILMTTFATAAGLIPLALGLGAGATVQQPLAVAVIGGLAFALLLSIPLAGGMYLIGTPTHRDSP